MKKTLFALAFLGICGHVYASNDNSLTFYDIKADPNNPSSCNASALNFLEGKKLDDFFKGHSTYNKQHTLEFVTHNVNGQKLEITKYLTSRKETISNHGGTSVVTQKVTLQIGNNKYNEISTRSLTVDQNGTASYQGSDKMTNGNCHYQMSFKIGQGLLEKVVKERHINDKLREKALAQLANS